MTNHESSFIQTAVRKLKLNSPPSTPAKVVLFYGYEYDTAEEIAIKYQEWLDTLDLEGTYAGAIGGRLTYKLTPTSLGLCCTVEDAITKTEFNLTNYGSW